MVSIDNNFQALLNKASTLKKSSTTKVDMSRVSSIILGGGKGTRLMPLTESNCKPAMLFAGRYRLIDIPLSNSIHSDIKKNFVVTQFLSTSLHTHIFQTYRNHEIELLSPEQKIDRCSWFQGTADAIRQNVEYLKEVDCDYFLILSGDQLYQIDFQKMYLEAVEKDVDLLVATLPVDKKSAQRMGLMRINEDQNIIDFHEKPKEEAILSRFQMPGKKETYLGSMGIYLFKKEALFDLLESDVREDFGKHLIPSKVKEGSIAAFIHNGYWEDIGTIESFYKANILLTQPNCPFDLHDLDTPIISKTSTLPGARLSSVYVENALISEGSEVRNCRIQNSILGLCTVVGDNSSIIDSYIMGNDHNSSGSIGKNCIIEKAIVDKNAKIGNDVILVNKDNLMEYESDKIFIRDGIIVVCKGAVIPDGFIL